MPLRAHRYVRWLPDPTRSTRWRQVKNTLQGVPPVETAWDSKDTAHYLKISIRHLSALRVEDPTFPKPRMLGTLPRWEPSAVKSWLTGEDERLTGSSHRRPAKKAGQRVH